METIVPLLKCIYYIRVDFVAGKNPINFSTTTSIPRYLIFSLKEDPNKNRSLGGALELVKSGKASVFFYIPRSPDRPFKIESDSLFLV
ncbi:hypothetical protein FCM35_KLT12590 [Carex littledalei]|uniref:Uncharacterized protein n=1 Tax=Carex littledalei TaxID=544730 RepID=A0A833V1K7_9POAL|nr:hypothetical protein FCM35_KLT12590 [Carex littledalei]